MSISSVFLDGLTPSAIRDITAFIREKKSRGIAVTNFAGGMPDSECFPERQLKAATEKILGSGDTELFQYAATDGYGPLRQAIAEMMNWYHVTADQEEILITSGSAQALNSISRALADRGETVVCESPVYVGAVDTLRMSSPDVTGIPVEEDGMDLDRLETVLKTRRVSFIYTIPDFQNPTGCSMSIKKRRELVRLACKYDTYIVEDSPYSLLSFTGTVLPAVKSFDTENRVLFLGSFSKTICPGIRIGFICGDRDSIRKLIYLKQRDDLQVNNLAQRQVYAILKEGGFEAHLKKTCAVYSERLECMLETVRRHFPEETECVAPSGGIFLWLNLNQKIDTVKFFHFLLERQIAFVPGAYFYVGKPCLSTMRLNFCTNKKSVIEEKIAEMGMALKEFAAYEGKRGGI